MSPVYNNPSVIRFLKESYDTENVQRISWFMRNKANIIESTLSSNKRNDYRTEDIARAYIEPLMPNLATHHELSWPNRLKKSTRHNPIVPTSETIKIGLDEKINAQEIYSGAIMMPVDPNITKILKEDLPYGGRQKYLNKRYELIPEEKYYFCETSSSICGWRLKNSKIGYPISDCKHKGMFFQILVSRSGPHPDPSHYNDAQNYSKCIS